MEPQKRLKISCPTCQQKLDVSDLEPFTYINCPVCKAELIVPKWFDSYLLEEPGGIGGMATVYRALDIALDREVAIKTLKSEYAVDPERAELFLHEARTAATINHYAVVPIYTCGVAEGMPYIVMQYMGGGSLEQKLKMAKGRLPVKDVALWMKNAAEGLENAHQHGIVHHDIKPGNILLDNEMNAKIGDFGIAQVVNRGIDSVSNIASTCLSPHYVSPEKVRTGKEDFLGDVYSLGATMYQLLTGSTPFNHSDVDELLRMRLTAAPADPAILRPEIGSRLSSLVREMMSIKPNERPDYPEIVIRLNEAIRQLDDPLPEGLVLPGTPVQKRESAKKTDPAKNFKPASSASRIPASADEKKSPVAAIVCMVLLFLLLAAGAFILYFTGAFGSGAVMEPVSLEGSDAMLAVQDGNPLSSMKFTDQIIRDASTSGLQKIASLTLHSYSYVLSGCPENAYPYDELYAMIPEQDRSGKLCRTLEMVHDVLVGKRNADECTAEKDREFDLAFASFLYVCSRSGELEPSDEQREQALQAFRKLEQTAPMADMDSTAALIFQERQKFWRQVLLSGKGVKQETEPMLRTFIREEAPWEFKPRSAGDLFADSVPAEKRKAVSRLTAESFSAKAIGKLFDRTRQAGRPCPKIITGFSMEKASYIQELPEEMRENESQRYRMMNQLRAWILSAGMRNAYSFEKFTASNGKVYRNGDLQFRRNEIMFRDGKKQEELSWDMISAQEAPAILAYYNRFRERSLTQAKEMDNPHFVKNLAKDLSLYALFCAWYGDYDKASETAAHIIRILPGDSTLTSLEKILLK